MTDIKRPMLAAPVDEAFIRGPKMQWPQIIQPKLDGIRCLLHPEYGPVSRKLKPIPNNMIRETLDRHRSLCLDGELLTYDGTGADVLQDFNSIQSDVMSRFGDPIFEFVAFDCFVDVNEPYHIRLQRVAEYTESLAKLGIIPSETVNDADDYLAYAGDLFTQGYEGVCSRTMDSPYKENRSTQNQGWLLKYKEVADAEGVVIGFEELNRNTNELGEDELGYAKRSHKKAGMVGGETLGALILKTEWGELRVGSGFDASMRDDLWKRRMLILGKVVTFKYQKQGMKELPRFPTFKGFRAD